MKPFNLHLQEGDIMERVLAFGCHPDDVEFMAAGTLALLAKQGCEIHIATMTGGEVGSPDKTSAEIKAIRIKEAAAAAAVIGATYHYTGGHDLEVDFNSEYRRMTTRVMRKVDPTIVLTHPPMDYLADHEETSRLVRNAAYIASVPLYDQEGPFKQTSRFPHLYYWNAMGLKDIFGRPLPLQCGVDVSSVIAVKEKMLLCHASQRDWLAHHNGWDAYTAVLRDMDIAQGKLIGRAQGECFIQHLGNGHPQDNILAKLLGNHMVLM
jgi:LmbE family N-acetylglucosaminyl deacetylase